MKSESLSFVLMAIEKEKVAVGSLIFGAKVRRIFQTTKLSKNFFRKFNVMIPSSSGTVAKVHIFSE